MKIKQTSYSSRNFTNLYIRFKEHKSHICNLSEIQNRKNKFVHNLSQDNISPKKNKYSADLYCKFKDDLNNFYIQNRLEEIKTKKNIKKNDVSRLIRTKESSLGILRKRHIEEIRLENERLGKRLNAKPFMSAKKVDMDYSQEHSRIIEKLKNVKPDKMLPKLNK